MTTREVVLAYLEAVKAGEEWEDFLANEMQFTSFADPVKRLSGKEASLEGIQRFYSMAKAMEIDRVLVDGEQACALTRYELQPPGGQPFESNIAEVFAVTSGKISSFGIYFDSAPYPKAPPQRREPNGA